MRGAGFTGTLVFVPGTSFIALAAADGTFAIHHVAPGTHTVVVHQPGQPAAMLQDPVTVVEGQVSSIGDIETSNTGSDTDNCGACGVVCSAGPNSSSECAGGACTITCSSGFSDCDGSLTNGCETGILTDEANCGACGVVCDSSHFCSAGVCRLPCPEGTTLSCGGEQCLAPGQQCS